MDEPEYAIFIQERGKRPRRVGQTASPSWTTHAHEGRTYHFATADLSAKTITYVDLKPNAATA